MSVRRRTLEHLARALAVTSVVSTACGCDPVPHPIVQTDPTTPPQSRGVPDDPPPVVCDPMPAPYCPPDAASAESLGRIIVSGSWVGPNLAVTLVFPYDRAYTVSGGPKVAHATVVSTERGYRGQTLNMTPESPNRPVRIAWTLDCEGQSAEVVAEIVPGAPGGVPRVDRVK